MDPELESGDIGWLVFFLKDFSKYQEYKWSILEHGAVISCRLVVISCCLLIGALDAVSIPMVVVTYKFIKNHCGDTFEVEDQFRVSTSENGDFSDSDDDFDVVDVSAFD